MLCIEDWVAPWSSMLCIEDWVAPYFFKIWQRHKTSNSLKFLGVNLASEPGLPFLKKGGA
jgi:hypothetical protein